MGGTYLGVSSTKKAASGGEGIKETPRKKKSLNTRKRHTSGIDREIKSVRSMRIFTAVELSKR